MKKYLNPNLEVQKMDMADVLTASIPAVEPPVGGGAEETPAIGIPIPRE